MAEELSILFEKIIAHGKTPNDCQRSIPRPYSENGGKGDPKIYCEISPLNPDLGTANISQEGETIGICEQQEGFRSYKNVDLIRAFNRVGVTDVLTFYRSRNIDPEIREIIKEINPK